MCIAIEKLVDMMPPNKGSYVLTAYNERKIVNLSEGEYSPKMAKYILALTDLKRLMLRRVTSIGDELQDLSGLHDLELLNIADSNFIRLPKLPNSLKYLAMDGCSIDTVVDKLPDGLKELDADDHILQECDFAVPAKCRTHRIKDTSIAGRRTETHHKFVWSVDHLSKFADSLDWTGDGSTGYILVLMARKKYDTNGRIKDGMIDFKIVRRKEELLGRVRRFECPLDSYSSGNSHIPSHCLGVYLSVRPIDLNAAASDLALNLVKSLGNNDTGRRLSAIHRHSLLKARKVGSMTAFDVDKGDFDPSMLDSMINKDAYCLVSTRGGYHLLVDNRAVESRFRNTWFNELAALSDVSPILSPLPGTIQGGYNVYTLEAK